MVTTGIFCDVSASKKSADGYNSTLANTQLFTKHTEHT